jgi:hypothetical protein
MGKNSGRNPTSWDKKFRISYWYWWVRHFCGYPDVGAEADKKLNDEFAWRNGRHPLENSAGQRRIFQDLRAGKLPPGRDPDFRNMQELLSAMDLDPRFKGLKEIYNAAFWDLLTDNVIKPVDAISKLDSILEAHNLKRVTLETLTGSLNSAQEILKEAGFIKIFQRCINKSNEGMDVFVVISIYWLLYIQNQFSGNSELRNFLIERLDVVVGFFFLHGKRIPPSPVRYKKVIDTIQSSRLDLSDGDAYLSKLEIEGEWLIVPKDLIGNVGKDFFSGVHLVRYSP